MNASFTKQKLVVYVIFFDLFRQALIIHDPSTFLIVTVRIFMIMFSQFCFKILPVLCSDKESEKDVLHCEKHVKI